MLLSVTCFCGCQRFGQKLFGVEERDRIVTIPAQASVVEGDITSDTTRVILLDMRMQTPTYLAVKLVHPSGTIVTLPVTTMAGKQVYVEQDRSMVIIKNAQTGLPSCPRYRIEYVK